ncbi:uncharacterized protein BDW43DRAFT_291307 [Aspergillus alliaceus]|uniref:uncharacterized protein n=1 Tax=Petromyces alliaceus TaxID=209559 RepID=UPI0012A6A3DD|nr:uncharacterized protein BDW43DRAFT_291307 [Aspergillus alliaceus]KAB8228532.1 hypothetical protein BDW43DRAFT_291307 [Aspergillus alliaceus]
MSRDPCQSWYPISYLISLSVSCFPSYPNYRERIGICYGTCNLTLYKSELTGRSVMTLYTF